MDVWVKLNERKKSEELREMLRGRKFESKRRKMIKWPTIRVIYTPYWGWYTPY